jgi:hypothetical protein
VRAQAVIGIKINIKGSGQECPLHTCGAVAAGLVLFPVVLSLGAAVRGELPEVAGRGSERRDPSTAHEDDRAIHIY